MYKRGAAYHTILGKKNIRQAKVPSPMMTKPWHK